MYDDLIIAGFGGQGIMLLGQMLTYAGLEEGYNVLWIPSYGPEMRGGAANCTVIFSDDEIGSPIISNPRSLILMNQPSIDKFEKALQSGGFLLYNVSMVNRKPTRDDVQILEIEATTEAYKLGNQRAANMVIMGAFLAVKPLVKLDTIRKLIEKHFEKKPKLIPLNLKALERGFELGKKGIKVST
ncbi:MAG: 2-oxoacid:acceptor oxidoreductase family protein [Candidatus Eremiobacteraeota bacterium]|nr:2-oxoacid:acceptor oxidoreductase family protein [Candidatus Eremiobacteraeota bacterium]